MEILRAFMALFEIKEDETKYIIDRRRKYRNYKVVFTETVKL